MMTWEFPDLLLLHVLHQLARVELDPQLPLSPPGGGKLHWVKHLGGVGEPLTR